ncbi:MAG: arylamine N-acetyltransferase [Actinomycetia bacterium]|nr:arylamine N-acetyltransferase [Actinomycetes bacterium]
MVSDTAMRYLERIGLSETPPLDVFGLEVLQRAHMTAVPFENLDVFARRGVETGLDWSIPKIVDRHRGGWCFELNGAFSAILEDLGFRVRRLGATVLLPNSANDPSHLVLEVDLGDVYLVDVGFGDSFIRPLLLDHDEVQDGGSDRFVIERDGDEHTLYRVGEDDTREDLYRFDPIEWDFADFDDASHRLQTAPGLPWTRARFATRLLDGGPDRVTLLEDRIRFRRNGVWTQEAVSPDEWESQLDQWFTMEP